MQAEDLMQVYEPALRGSAIQSGVNEMHFWLQGVPVQTVMVAKSPVLEHTVNIYRSRLQVV